MLDYASIIQGGQQLVPDIRRQLMEDALFKQQQTEFRQAQEARAAQAQQQAEMKAREGEFQGALEDVMLNPTPQKINALRMRFPEFAKAYKDGFDGMDADMRQTNVTQIGSIFANLEAGNVNRAVAILEQRTATDRAAGEDVSEDEAILAELKSGDPARVKAAKATIGIMLASATGDKFAEVYGKVNPAERIDPTQREYEWRTSQFGKVAADAWLATQDTKLVPVQPGGTVYSYGPGEAASQGAQPAAQGGGDPSGSGASIPATGAAIERAALSVVPGAIVTSRQRSPARNAAVGGTANSYHLTDQARDFVPPKGMSMSQLASQLKRTMPGFDVINEGDHVHVEPSGSRRSAGPVRVRSKQEYDRLPAGSSYIAPDGSQRVKS